MQKRSGYSLVELSIVIILIGLISGLILAGQSFVRRQELRRVIVDSNGLVAAIEQFRLKYGEMPGDFAGATNVWGALATCPTDPSNGTTATCNGNGNGFINGRTPEAPTNDATLCEHYRVWQHLANGGYIQGSYTGISGLASCANNSLPETNVPRGAIDGTGYTISSFGYFVSESDTTFYDGDYKNAIIYGGAAPPSSPGFTLFPALKADEAKEIDRKIDDGKPGLGNVRGRRPGTTATPNCTDKLGATSVSATDFYRELNNTGATCSLVFMDTYLKKNNR